jgi:hypothetical protein
VNPAAAWHGWHRTGKRDRWLCVSEGATHTEAWMSLLGWMQEHGKGGESMVLTKGRRPIEGKTADEGESALKGAFEGNQEDR